MEHDRSHFYRASRRWRQGFASLRSEVQALRGPARPGTVALVITCMLAGLAATAPYANADTCPAQFALSDLLEVNGGDGRLGFAINGIDAGDQAGKSVSYLGDMNGDGVDDVAVGAHLADPNGEAEAGEVYVVFGRDGTRSDHFDAEFDLSSLLSANGGDGSSGFVLLGDAPVDWTGFTIASAGDLDNDGLADLIVGAIAADVGAQNEAGRAYVVFGSDQGFVAELALSTLAAGDGSAGFVLDGIDVHDLTGWVGTAGDFNGDDIDDLIIGAPDADPSGHDLAGEVYVVYGRDTDVTGNFPAVFDLSELATGDGSTGFVLNGIADENLCGHAVANAGDMNADGIDDMIIGANWADPNGIDSGETYVVFGSDQGFPPVFELSLLDGNSGFVINGMNAYDNSGLPVNGAGDVNGDSIADVIIGGAFANPHGYIDAGQAYVVFGSDTGFPAVLELSDLNGDNGFVLNGIVSRDYAGSGANGAGDVNADGIDDLIVGAPSADPINQDNGEVYVVFGTDQGYPPVIELSSLNGSNGVELTGAFLWDRAGNDVDHAGDVNNDGIDDLIIGARTAINPAPDTGRVYVLFGQADSDGDCSYDVADNCVHEPNADQRDTDADGFGNLCDADLNDDCVVNVLDLGLLRSVFFTSDPDADFNGDGVVNAQDLGIMKSRYFLPPGPSGVPNVCDGS